MDSQVMGFVGSTRQNIRNAGRLDYVSGGQSILPLPRVGYLRAIHVHISGNMQVTLNAGTATLGEQAPWSLLRRVRYTIGTGTELVNVSGFGMYLVDLHSRLGYKPENGEISAPYTAQIYAAAAAAGANAWEFGFTVPITPNERDLAGLILLQSEGTVTQLTLEWQSGGGLTHDFPVVLTSTATAVFTGNARISLETFTVPGEVGNQPPLDRIHQIFERADPIFAVGEQSVRLLEQNTYLRLIHVIQINARLNTTDVERLAFRYNITDVPYDIDRALYLQLKRRQWTKDFPIGVYSWEFYDQGYPNFGGERDLVSASGLAELESLIYVAAGATLGGGNNVIRTIQQQLVDVDIPTVAAAS